MSYKTRINLQACDTACTDCHLKYFKDKFSKEEKFGISCQGIPLNPVPDNILSQFSEKDHAQAIGLFDPVIWAKETINWEARWYQTIMLRCSAKHMVARLGRRCGKSETIAVRILHALSTRANYKCLIVAPYKSQSEIVFGKVKEFIQRNSQLANSVKRVVASPYPAIEMHNGSYARFFTAGTKSSSGAEAVRGQPADCFIAGTRVNTTEFATRPIETLNIDLPITGGDSSGISIGNIECLSKKQQCDVISISTILNSAVCTLEHPLFDGEIDIPAKDANKVVVSLAHQELTFSIPVIKARLAGYNFGDGWIASSNRSAGFAGQAEDLEQIIEDLCLLGDSRHKITTTFKENKKLGIRGIVSEFCSTLAFDLLKDFCPHGRKTEQLIQVPEWVQNGTEYIKAEFLSGLFSAESTSIKYQKNNRTPRAIALRMVSCKQENIISWLEQIKSLFTDLNIATSPVKTWPKKDNGKWYGEIKVNSAKENLDRYVKRVGFCYNVKKRISANIWKLYRHYESEYQLSHWEKNRLIYKTVGSNSKISTELNIPLSTVKYHKKERNWLYSGSKRTPDEVVNFYKWKDNYVLLPIQTKNRWPLGKADVYNLQTDSINAKHRYIAEGMLTHNCIFLDEADYLAEADLTAVLAIRVEHPNVKVWASSTPTGMHSRFRKWCMDPLWKEFHFPSSVLPHWDAALEAECRDNAGTEMAYLHEYMASWGEAEEGVYQSVFVEQAQMDYKYEEMQPQKNWIYCIGVDWNDAKVGTEICVLGWDLDTRKHWIVNRTNMEKANWTQIRAMEAITELNRRWNPKLIYVDRGFGSTQIELLEKFGWDSLALKGPNHPDSRFREHLKAFDFGGKVTVHDPHTKQAIEKDAKPFLVNNSVRAFEQQEICYSKHDKSLTAQLHGYKIDRVTVSGRPVYEADEKAGDHGLDALNLALVAFKLHMTEWGLPVFNATIGFAGNFGDKKTARPNEYTLPGEMKIQYDPEYEKRKLMEQKQDNLDQFDRTREFSDRQRSTTVRPINLQRPNQPWTNPGFDTDTEWKFKKKVSLLAARRKSIPLSRNRSIR